MNYRGKRKQVPLAVIGDNLLNEYELVRLTAERVKQIISQEKK